MREDNGVVRNFNYYIIKIPEMSIVLADYLQRKACAWHGPAHLPRQLLAELLQRGVKLVSGSRGPPQLDFRLDGEFPFGCWARVLPQTCVCRPSGLHHARALAPQLSQLLHPSPARSPQSLARARDPHPAVLYCGTKRLMFTEGRD